MLGSAGKSTKQNGTYPEDIHQICKQSHIAMGPINSSIDFITIFLQTLEEIPTPVVY